jgi:type I restriction enzyme S subunit
VNYVDKRFAEYAHSTPGVTDLLKASAVGAIAVGAGPALNEVAFSFPSLSAQRAIAAYLDAETSRIDDVITMESRMMALLHEHRQALITAAVTGEIDVRGAAP